MPSSVVRHAAGLVASVNLTHEMLNPDPRSATPISGVGIQSPESATGSTVGYISGSGAWQTANEARLVPFCLNRAMSFDRVWWYNYTTVGTDSVDVGIYDAAFVRLASSGGTLTAGTSVSQVASLTAEVTLQPGMYYLAIAVSGTTDTFLGTPGSASYPASLFRILGAVAQATAYPLPTSITPTTPAASQPGYCPWHGLIGAEVG